MSLTSPESAPAAWVLRCIICGGGIIYALSTIETEQLLTEFDMQPERGPIDRLWEIDYCTCTEVPHGPSPA